MPAANTAPPTATMKIANAIAGIATQTRGAEVRRGVAPARALGAAARGGGHQRPPKRRRRASNSASANSKSARPKSGHSTSVKCSSE